MRTTQWNRAVQKIFESNFNLKLLKYDKLIQNCANIVYFGHVGFSAFCRKPK